LNAINLNSKYGRIISFQEGSLVIDSLKKEELSLSYLNVICAYKGIAVEYQRHDEDSIDVIIKKTMVKSNGQERKTLLGVQLKATAQKLVEDDTGFSYPLKKKNFKDLRMDSAIPMMLCVLRLPEKEADWLTHTVDELILRNCMYWCDITKLPDSDNETSISIHIPNENTLTPEKVLSLMQKVAETRLL
jgi:hypothetical protein